MSIPLNSAQLYNQFLQYELFTKESQKKIRNFVCPLCKGICNFPVVYSNNDKTYCNECILKYYSIHHRYPLSNSRTDESKPIPVTVKKICPLARPKYTGTSTPLSTRRTHL